MALTPGLLLSERYRLTERIAVGGMGEVWAADDGRLGRRIAIKILKSELTSDTEFVDRFRTEARITASLNHSGIASVYDYGEVASIAGGPRDTAFLVMELVSGEPLSAVLARQTKISVPRVLDVLEQSGRALQVAHLRSLVHRDIKPGNIMVTPAGQVKITDFGIAKAAYQVPITQGGMVMGTAQYLSPEQAAGHDAVPASDIYALGIVAFECLAGERPFQADSPVEIASMQVNNAPPPLPADVPPMISALVSRMLAKDPRSRFADGAALAEAVAQVRAGRTVAGSAAAPATTVVVGPLSGPIGAPGPRASAAHAAQAVHDAQVRISHGLAPMPRRVARRTGVSWAIGLTILLLAVAAGWYLAHRAGTGGAAAAMLLVGPITRPPGPRSAAARDQCAPRRHRPAAALVAPAGSLITPAGSLITPAAAAVSPIRAFHLGHSSVGWDSICCARVGAGGVPDRIGCSHTDHRHTDHSDETRTGEGPR